MMSAERKRLTPLLLLETVDGKKITVTSTWSGTVLVALKINQLWNGSKETFEMNVPESVSSKDGFVSNLKNIILEHIETKSLRFAKA